MLKNLTIGQINSLYDEAEKAVFIALRARHEKSGQEFLHELQVTQNRDKITRDRNALCEKLTALEKQLKHKREKLQAVTKERDYCSRQLSRLTLSTEELNAYCVLYQSCNKKAKALQDDCKSLENSIKDLVERMEQNSSERADLVQIAMEQLLHNMLTPATITDKLIKDNPNATTDELQNIANFKAVINAVGKNISTLSSPDALNSHATRIIAKLTAEQLEEIRQYKRITIINDNGTTTTEYFDNNGKYYVNVRRARTSDCYDTIEERDPKRGKFRNMGKGLYIVRHWVTTSPYQYIETYENGNNDIESVKTYNPFISNFEDLEQIRDLMEGCNLTYREQIILDAFMNGCRYTSNFTDCQAYAFNRLYQVTGEYIRKDARRQIWSRLTRKLKTRYNELRNNK